MADTISPLITFKAGICDFDISVTPPKVTPKPEPGWLYLYDEDGLIHFCWRRRGAPMTEPELDLTMVPSDGHFKPHTVLPLAESNGKPKGRTNGRIFVLGFQSSTQKHLFWLQSKSQHSNEDPSYFSPRDLKHGEIVDRLLQGDEFNVQEELNNVPEDKGNEGGSYGDVAWVDVGSRAPGGAQGRGGGESSGTGGAAGGQGTSSTEASEAVQNFLQSLQGNQALPNPQSQSDIQGPPFTTLPDLLPPFTTIPVIDSATESSIDNLLSYLPSQLLLLSQEADDISSVDPNSETANAAMQALNVGQKREILRKVLRSPQFSQSLGSLTTAIRDGGLPSISDALKIPVENGGFLRRGGVPVGGGDAVESFLNGVKAAVQEKGHHSSGEKDDSHMDTT